MSIWSIFLVLQGIQSAISVHHSLQYIYTASSGIQNFPEFVAVGLVDGNEVMYYDSNIREAKPKQDWMKRVTEDDPQYWDFQTHELSRTQKSFIDSIEVAKQRFNQTGGVHIFQNMYGCEFNDEYEEVEGWENFGYDGEDFIALDLKTERWSAPVYQASITKNKWDNDNRKMALTKNYITQIGPDWLKKYLEYGKNSLLKTDVPSVSFLQKSPSSPVCCHATGFYPSRAEMFWRKDGEEIHDGADKQEILPNNDGTFQMSIYIDLSSVPSEDWTKHKCVFQLFGLKDDLVIQLEKTQIQSNYEYSYVLIISLTVVVILCLATLALSGYVYTLRKKNGKDRRMINAVKLCEAQEEMLSKNEMKLSLRHRDLDRRQFEMSS
ncbi:major histocompatibility complex class I-related gene protein-like [Xiphophorus hellerii]|uniref:major histocompatibility complex class I-related gene protein-like n=1 Tax=Xiphophorus hellerii TaxID=8084 RepID=UPI0013B37924|nr:major histocompatibility complex class I-related gene protein-like [Xiphophorus hellerii]